MNKDDTTQAITDALAALDGPTGKGAFACKGNLPSDTLALSIDGFGDLRLPIAMTRAKALARIATSAPFGLGRETVIDSSVRDVGEIKASKVRFDRRAWNRELKPVLETMRVELGLPDGRLTARLDKLLVYGPGQFFKPHKDTERSDEMIGTLVVVLPSRHKGGSLVIYHQGETRRFVVRNPADPLLRMFAFYATSEHEVRPVSEGHRVVLSFELRFKRADNKGTIPVEPTLKKALESWFDSAREPSGSYAFDAGKLVFLLDHDYSQRSLSWRRLKGVDHRRAEALQHAATSLDLEVHLALVNVSETWNASVEEPDYSCGRGGRRGWYEYDDDDDDDESTDSGNAETDYELDELIERVASLDHWRGDSDQKVPIPTLCAFDEEICWISGLEDNAPELEEYEGYMGNYGSTLEREYKRAAVVLWPAGDRYRILAQTGGESGVAMAFGELLHDTTVLDAGQLAAAVHSLLDVWPGGHRSKDSILLSKALALSMQLDKADTVIELLRSFSLAAVKMSHFKTLLPLGQRYGAVFCQTLFAHWSGVNPPKTLRAPASGHRKKGYGRDFDRDSDRQRLDWLPSFAGFCRRVNALKDDAWKAVTESLFDTLHTIAIEDHAKRHAMVSMKSRRQNVVRECMQLQSLLEAAQEIDKSKVKQVVVKLTRELEQYDSEVLVAVLEHLANNEKEGKPDKVQESLATKTRKLVNKRAVKAVRAKGDWRIDVPISCKCADCQTLTRFLQSREQSIDLPLAKARRQHLHGRIDGYEIPVSHSTRRQGSPFVLELRKRHTLFHESAREHARQSELLDRVVPNPNYS